MPRAAPLQQAPRRSGAGGGVLGAHLLTTIGNCSFIIHWCIATAVLSGAAILRREEPAVEGRRDSCQLLSPAALGGFNQPKEIKPRKNPTHWDGEEVGTSAAKSGARSSFPGNCEYANSCDDLCGLELAYLLRVIRITYKDIPFSIEGHVLCPESPKRG